MSFLAIFDVDGTLVDSQNHILTAMDHAHDTVGMARLSRETVLEIVGLSLPEAFRYLHPAQSEAVIAALVEGYKDTFRSLREAGSAPDSPFFAGAFDGLNRLGQRTDVLLGTATGKSKRGLDALIDTHELRPHFVTLQCADGHPSKPNPSMVLTAMAETGTAPSRTVMIGDTEFDIAMGRAAGVRTIGVTWGYHAVPRLRAAGADHLVDDWQSLEDLILELAQ
jgi:phosphoglycolate phosphatase